MALFISIIIIVILFIVGISFIMKSLFDTNTAALEAEKAQKELEAEKAAEEKLSGELDSAKSELAEAQAGLQEAKKMEKVVASLEDKEKSYTNDINKLNQKIQMIFNKADQQAKDALDVIDMLKKDNETLKTNVEKQAESAAETQTLKTQIEESQGKIQQLEGDLAKSKEENTQQLQEAQEAVEKLKSENESLQGQAGDSAQLKDLEENLAKVRQESEAKLTEVNSFVENLKTENQTLQDKLSESERQLAEANSVISELKSANQNLQDQTAGGPTQVQGLEEDVQRVKQEGEDQLVQATATIDNLKFENLDLQKQMDESLQKIKQLEEELGELRTQKGEGDAPQKEEELKELCDDFKSQLGEMKKAVFELKEDQPSQDEPTPAKADLKQRLDRLKKINEFLVEKEKKMQFELTKSRAKAKGLEKICADFRVQLESMGNKADT